LKGRLTAGLVLTLVVVFVLQWLAVSLAIRRLAESYMISRLEHDSDSLLAAFSLKESGVLKLPSGRVAMVYEQPFSGHYYRIAAGGTVLRSRSLWDQDLEIPALGPGEHAELHVAGPEDQPLLVLARGFQKQGTQLTLAVAEDLTPLHRDLAQFQEYYLLLSLCLMGVLILLQRYTVGRALRPLEQVRESLGRLVSGEQSQLSGDVPQEIRPLTEEINRLVGFLVRRLGQTRTAVGNLSHALKTPLTLLIQLADDEHFRSQPKLRDRLVRETGAIRERLDRESKRAQFAGEGPAGTFFKPASDVPDLVEALKRMYGDKPLDIRLEISEGLAFAADREDMLELIGNLASNACKWAEKRVALRLTEEGDGHEILVEDDGPGRSGEELGQLGQRGLRLDESKEGHGLGLAIAQEIAEAYGGRLEFSRSADLGGLRVRVWIPHRMAP
jgi:signal transduction histidine kinase